MCSLKKCYYVACDYHKIIVLCLSESEFIIVNPIQLKGGLLCCVRMPIPKV